MNILLVDCDFGELPGHTVRKANLGDTGGIVPVQWLLNAPEADGGNFRPDVIIQMEYLGRRVFLSGMSELDCPKIFWAVDSHLNLFWQRWYGRLFDVVLTPHTGGATTEAVQGMLRLLLENLDAVLNGRDAVTPVS